MIARKNCFIRREKIAEPFELRIVGPDRKEVSDGAVGEIAVRGPFLMQGYYNDPSATKKVIDQEGWYYTSDLGFRDPEGYIHLTGRSSEMFKSGGENVYPREVEEVIESQDSVLFAAVIAVTAYLISGSRMGLCNASARQGGHSGTVA